MRIIAVIFLFCTPLFVSATVFINEIQISPIGERFIELYNSGNSNINLTGWYIQRKTATGNSFSSLVTSTQLKDKIINSNDYFVISRGQLANSDVVIDNLTLTESNTIRVRDSKGENVDQVELAVIGEGKSYQRISTNEWIVALPTLGAENTVSQNTNTIFATNTAVQQTVPPSPQPPTPKVSAEAGPQTRVVLAGTPIIFEGKVAGLGNNSSGAIRATWSFGDGASAEGESVAHTYYYPGEYTAVLDVVSGSLTATDKMLVRVVLPNLSLRAGGDGDRAFFTIENRSGDELDISGWQVASGEKTFTFPQHTILGARKNATFASEVTGLATPVGNIPELRFPNGSRVEVKSEPTVIEKSAPKVMQTVVVKSAPETRASPQTPKHQEATVALAVEDAEPPAKQKNESLWPWYIGAAFLGALALVGLRLAKDDEGKASITAEDFEIIEEADDGEPH